MNAAPNSGLRNHRWPRFLKGPDSELRDRLYVPGLSESIRYDRCCAYFSSSVLSAAARGFGPLIQRLIDLGESAPRPAVRLVVNEELSENDVKALLETGNTAVLEASLLKKLKNPKDLLEQRRLGMLAWLVKSGLLDIRVGVMREGNGILHAKFGLLYDAVGDAVVFMGSGNESARGLLANYEHLEVSTSWTDQERFEQYKTEFDELWSDAHRTVHTVSLPEAVEKKLIKFAPEEPPINEPVDRLSRKKAAMLWRFIASAPYLPNGASSCEATAPLAELWPHQKAVVEEVAAAWPEGRLLCDEVGMGKTIEAIMILRRLFAGRGVRRALLLVPAGLTKQWQEELREKGGLSVPRLQGNNMLVWPSGRTETRKGLAECLWSDVLIASRELARLESNRQTFLAATPWDLVLLDEAHAARRAKQEEGEFNSGTLLLELLRQLRISGVAKSLLLLSATPMQTHPWEPWDLLSVLGEGGAWTADFAAIRSYYASIRALEDGRTPERSDSRTTAWLTSQDPSISPPPAIQPFKSAEDGDLKLRSVPPGTRVSIAQWLRSSSPLARRMHRNTRETLREYHANGLLSEPPTQRIPHDIVFDYQPENGPERRLYDAVGEYINRRFEELENEKPGKGFVMTIYRRRASSSPHALKCSLSRRKDGLRRVLQQMTVGGYVDLFDVPESVDEEDLPEGIEVGSIPSSLPQTKEQARGELVDVDRLLEALSALGGMDTKRDRFFELVRQLRDEGRPILVFTEYADTMEYLRDALAAAFDSEVGSYSGKGGGVRDGDGWKEVSKAHIIEQLQSGAIRILVCTDAASEGLNLQSASALINYDLPWNPSRVEQRIGRIDRIGQREKVVKVYNLFLHDSIDQKVYSRLETRCGLFSHYVGPMQPVLARARFMLMQTKPFSLEELDAVAQNVESDTLLVEPYRSAHAKVIDQAPPAVGREDVVFALRSLHPDFGISAKVDGEVQLKGLERNIIHIGLDSKTLDENPSYRTLTAGDPLSEMITQKLARAGELLPLVIGTESKRSIKAACAVWVTENGLHHITTFKELTDLLTTWDGWTPSSARIREAQRYVKDANSKVIADIHARVQSVVSRGIQTQREAARIRLARELGRLLKCLDKDNPDLQSILAIHAESVSGLSDRLREARVRLGLDFNWSNYLRWEIEQFTESMTPNEEKSRLSGSSIDAAFADYRWVTGSTVEV